MSELVCSEVFALTGPNEREAAAVRHLFSDPVASERFWALVEKGDGCWEWRGRKGGSGYGVVTHRARNIQAHRAAFLASGGVIPPGMQLDHRCFNRGCVRPLHLEPVTGVENSRRGQERINGGDNFATPRQLEILKFIEGFVVANDCPPSIREIGGAIGLVSTNGVNDHLKALEAKGLIERARQRARSLRITHAGRLALMESSSTSTPKTQEAE